MAHDKFSLGLTDPFREDQSFGFDSEELERAVESMPTAPPDMDKSARKAAKRAAREQRIAEGGNPKAWKNMNKGAKALTVFKMIAGTLMTGGNPVFALAMRDTEKKVAQKRIDKLEEGEVEREHDLIKIKAETEGQKEVIELGGKIQSGHIAQEGDIRMSVLDREWDHRSTAQQNQNNFDGDQVLVKILGEKWLQDIRIEANQEEGGLERGHQTSLAMLQARRDQVKTLTTNLIAALGPGSELAVLDYTGRLEPYILHGGPMPDYTSEMVEGLEQVYRMTQIQRGAAVESARLENLANARQILALSSPKGETIMSPEDPRFGFIQGLASNVNSLATPEESSIAAASLLSTPKGQQLHGHLATLFTRPNTPTLMDVDVVATEIVNMDVPLNVVAARELLFQTGADPDAVNARIALPDGYLDPDPLDRSPEVTRKKREYGHYVEPALDAADTLSKEFGRAVRIWLDKNGTGDYRTDYSQLWRIIKHYQTSDDKLRGPLMDYLAGGRETTGYTGIGGQPITRRNR